MHDEVTCNIVANYSAVHKRKCHWLMSFLSYLSTNDDKNRSIQTLPVNGINRRIFHQVFDWWWNKPDNSCDVSNVNLLDLEML